MLYQCHSVEGEVGWGAETCGVIAIVYMLCSNERKLLVFLVRENIFVGIFALM